MDAVIKTVANRLRLAVTLGRVLLSSSPAGKVQRIQLSGLPSELRDGLQAPQAYAFASCALPGAVPVLVPVGGNRTDLIAVIVEDSQYRPELEAGESSHHNHLGDYFRIRKGRIVEINAGGHVEVTAPEATFNCSSKVVLNTPLVHMTGALQVDGAAVVQGALSSATSVSDPAGTLQGVRGAHNDHNHNGDASNPPSVLA